MGTRAAAVAETPASDPEQTDPHTKYTTAEILFLWGVIILGLITRWYELDLRPVHHDESQHGMFGKYFYDFPDHNFYRYTPMLHGPLLYNIYRFIYLTFGSNNFSLRIPMCFLGSLALFLPYLFRRYFSRTGVLFLTAAVAISPTLTYWSRFAREDFYVLFGLFSMLYGAALAPARWKSFFVFFGLTIHFCSKENVFVHIALFLGYAIYEYIFIYLRIWKEESIVVRMFKNVRKYPFEFFITFAYCAFIYCYLYSAGFRHMEGILDGLGRTSIAYWAEHHNIERIKGPFLFQFYTLAWYELLFTIAFFTHIFLFYKNGEHWVRSIGTAVVMLSLASVFYHINTEVPVESLGIWAFFKLKDPLDVVGLWVLLIHPLVVTTYHMMRGEKLLAYWGYLFTAMFFTYSYLGEKVPWLSLYPLIPGLVYLTLYFEDHFRRNPLTNYGETSWRKTFYFIGGALAVLGIIFNLEEKFSAEAMHSNAGTFMVAAMFLFAGLADDIQLQRKMLQSSGMNPGEWSGEKSRFFGTYNLKVWLLAFMVLFNLRESYLTNFLYTGEASEFISQVHTSREFDHIMAKIRDEMTSPMNGYKPEVLGKGESTWPMTWYMVDLPGFQFNIPEGKKLQDYDYVFDTWEDDKQLQNVPEGFRARRLDFRGWWVPEYPTMSLKKFLLYSLNHKNWSSTGYTYLLFLSKIKKEQGS